MSETDRATADDRSVRLARIAVSWAFFAFGLLFGLWAAHIPAVALRLSLDPAVLGFAILFIGLGGIISQPMAGWLMGRSGSRLVTVIALPVTIVAFLLLIVAWSLPVLFVAALTVGVIGGGTNVGINTQASEIERARGRPTMSSFHGFFSFGGLAGAAIGGLIFAAGWQDGRGAAVVCLVLLAASLVLSRHFLRRQVKASTAEAGGRRFALPAPAVLGFALMAFLANMIEGGVNDWSALYLTTVRHIAPALAVSGFAIFSLAMGVLRLASGPVVARFGDQAIVAGGGLLAAIGMTVVLLSPWSGVSPFGFALVALGAANNMPVLIGAAARAGGATAGNGVAAAATGGLLGFLIGPPVLGFIGHALGLSATFAACCVIALAVSAGAIVYRWPARFDALSP